MKYITKKVIIYSIYSMLASLPIGLGASVVDASPLYNDPVSMLQQYDQDQDQVRREAERNENERHERAMERRPNESDREWEERQKRENERHEKRLWIISRAVFN